MRFLNFIIKRIFKFVLEVLVKKKGKSTHILGLSEHLNFYRRKSLARGYNLFDIIYTEKQLKEIEILFHF